MRIGVCGGFKTVAAVCLLLLAGARLAVAQDDAEMTATRRILPGIGPGLRAVKRGADGRTYVLASPSPGLAVFDAKGNQVLLIATAPPGSKPGEGLIMFGEDCDIDPDGRMYVADSGANLVEVFSVEGKLVRTIPVNAPISVSALPEGEVAVATLRDPHLVLVFEKNGREVREFGDPEQISDREDLNRFLNIGQLARDGDGHLYYAFGYVPEPTVRQFDRFGYGGQDVQYTGIDAAPEAVAVRREIQKQEKRKNAPAFKRVLTGVGIDPATGEVWMLLHNTLLHFDREGNRRASYLLYTPEGGRLEANTILIETDHVLIGGDPAGIYEFDRPDKKKPH
jgi:hypothetical protein